MVKGESVYYSDIDCDLVCSHPGLFSENRPNGKPCYNEQFNPLLTYNCTQLMEYSSYTSGVDTTTNCQGEIILRLQVIITFIIDYETEKHHMFTFDKLLIGYTYSEWSSPLIGKKSFWQYKTLQAVRELEPSNFSFLLLCRFIQIMSTFKHSVLLQLLKSVLKQRLYYCWETTNRHTVNGLWWIQYSDCFLDTFKGFVSLNTDGLLLQILELQTLSGTQA